MPQNHPLSDVSVTRTQRRLIGDMEVNNDLFFDKDIFTKVVHEENPMSPLFVFGKVLGGQGGALDEMFEPVTEGMGAEWIKIMEQTDFSEPARIKDRSRVPEWMVAGENFELTIDKAVADPDESLMLRDEKTMLRIEARRPGLNGTDLTVQLIGIPGSKKPGAFLRVNDPIHIGYGNSKGQASMNSNTLVDDLTKRTTFFNLSNITRYGFSRTGSEMSDEVYKFAVTNAMDGSKVDNFRTDLPVKFMRKVLQTVDKALLYNVPNFNPRTRQIANRSSVGRYHERPYYAGFYWMLDHCPWKWTQSKRASFDEGVQKLDFIMNFFYNKLGRKNTIFAMCSGAGAEWMRQTILQGGLRKYGATLFQTVTGGDKLKIGFEADEYITSHGRIIIYDIGQALNKWEEFDRTTYNGISYNERSNDIFLIPAAVKGENGRAKRPAHIYFKEGNGVSRAFAFGYQNGITGEGNGFTAEQLLGMQDEFLRRNAQNSRYRMDSTVDGKEFHVLMQLVPYLDVRNIVRLRLK